MNMICFLEWLIDLDVGGNAEMFFFPFFFLFLFSFLLVHVMGCSTVSLRYDGCFIKRSVYIEKILVWSTEVECTTQ